jgi:uncharacterized membrane protein
MNRIYFALSLLLTAGMIIGSAVINSQLPERVPIHWNIHGQVDGYGSRAVASFLLPSIAAGMLLLFAVLPWASPKPFALDSFRETYWFIVLVVTCMMVYVQCVLLWAAAGGHVDAVRAILLGMLVMFGCMGNVMGKVRRNLYVGVRTPWTLANDRVWNETHRLAGRMFVAAAVLGVPMLLLPVPVMIVFVAVVGLILAAALFPAGYSLVLYRRLDAEGQLETRA